MNLQYLLNDLPCPISLLAKAAPGLPISFVAYGGNYTKHKANYMETVYINF